MKIREFVEDRDEIVEEIRKDVVSEKEKNKESEGPGYIGWCMDEKENKQEKGNEMKQDVGSLFKLFQGMDAKLQDTTKQMNSLKKEVKDLKEEYKHCMEALANETYSRNKAEALNKALQESIEVERSLK